MPPAKPIIQKADIQFRIPKVLLDRFEEEPRFILKPYPGILLLDIKNLQVLLEDKEWAKNYDVVLMPKG